MVRTQVYLTERQREALAALARSGKKKQADLIREAIDRLIDQESRTRREEILHQTAGLWKDRTDLPDYEAIRAGWDRQS